MSKRINVNPGQYKVAGRERQGEEILQAQHKRKYVATKQRAGGKAGAPAARPKKSGPGRG